MVMDYSFQLKYQKTQTGCEQFKISLISYKTHYSPFIYSVLHTTLQSDIGKLGSWIEIWYLWYISLSEANMSAAPGLNPALG